MPPAARITDVHACPIPPHGAPPIISGSSNVIIGNMPAARLTDKLACAPPDVIVQGSPTVLINNLLASRLGDSTAHGGKIIMGCPTVIIGDSGQGATLKGSAATGAPFCAECEKAKKELAANEAKEAAKKAADAAQDPPTDTTTVANPAAPTKAAPPAPAKPQVVLQDVSPETVAKAAEPGSSPAHIEARQKVAFEFYKQNGLKYPWGEQEGPPQRMPIADIASHLKGIDFTKPVTFGPQPPMPKVLHQFQCPWAAQGQYYAHEDASPESLGILAVANKAAGEPAVTKLKKMYELAAEAPYLHTTAGKIDVTWDLKGESHEAKGGSPQFFMPGRHHAKHTPKS